MDPDANLAEQLRIANQDDISPEDAMRLADLVLALHCWLADCGGALPKMWQHEEGM